MIFHLSLKIELDGLHGQHINLMMSQVAKALLVLVFYVYQCGVETLCLLDEAVEAGL